MEITINRFNRFSGSGRVVAFFDICYGKLIIKGFKLINGDKGYFVSNPSEKGKDEKYYDTVFFLDMTEKKQVEELAIQMYEKEE